MNNIAHHLLRITIVLLAVMAGRQAVTAQTELRMEAQSTTSSGDFTPLWLNANRYGLSSLDKDNGYIRAGLFHATNDTSRHWTMGYGVDVAVARHFTSTLVIQQAYADIGWKRWHLTLGSKEQPVEMRNQQLSSGAQTLGVNARPVPTARLALAEYSMVPGIRWLAVKGHLSFGLLTDDNWQEDFANGDNRYTTGTLYHSKAGYLRIGRPGRSVNVELGLEMGCLFGGVSHRRINGHTDEVANRTGLGAFFNALIPSGGEVGEGQYKNREGNHLGSYLIRVNVCRPSFDFGLYADHFFEDHSQMFFVDYNGYGEGEEYQEWKHNRWILYDFRDIMLGADLRLKRCRWLDAVTLEYLYTKYQSGPVNHDRTKEISDHVAGIDDYYNHFLNSGWQHWGQVMGNPLYSSPLYNTDGSVRVADNRFWAWHAGISGQLITGLRYRLLASLQRGWGSYNYPFPDPERNTSIMAEAEYTPPAATALDGWGFKAAWGMDHGKILGNNMGVQLTVSRRLLLR